MVGRLLRVTGTVPVIAVALVVPVLATTSTPAAADTVINGCTIVSNPTPTHFTNCPGVNFAGSSLSGLNLSFANLSPAGFVSCQSGPPPTCSGTDLTGANLTKANLSGDGFFDDAIAHDPLLEIASASANFSNANLSGADLINASFAGANLSGANLTGASLTGASMAGTDPTTGVTIPATLTGANFTGTLLVPSNQSVTATSQEGAVATWSTPSGIPGATPGSCTPASGSTFPLFVSTVTCQVLDSANDVATGTFQVGVQPTTQYFTRVLVPADGAVLSGAPYLAAGATDAPGITSVVFEVSGGTLNDQVVSSSGLTIFGWLGQWNTTAVPDGTYSLQSVATDADGNTDTSLPITVRVNNHPPTTAIGIPSNGATLSGGLYLDASASDPGGLTKVEYHLTGGAIQDQVIATATPTIVGWLAGWDTTQVFNGTYTLQSVAYDTAGFSARSAAVTVTVDNAQPATSVLVPSNGATLIGTQNLQTSAVDGTTKVVFEVTGGSLNDQVVATATQTASGWSASWDTTPFANGTYTLNSVASDANGNTSTSTGVTVLISNPPRASTAYVVNNSDSTVTPISVATDTAGTPISVGRNPDAIAITPNEATAYVLNETDGTVTPIDTTFNTASTAIPVGDDPGYIAITPNGATAYVSNIEDDTVTPIDTVTNTAGTPIPVGRFPVAIAITPNGATAYVLDVNGSTVTPIDTATNTAGTAIPVGGEPGSIAITPNGATAYVSNVSNGTVIPIDTATNTAGTPIPVGSGPDAIAITPNGATAYVLNVDGSTVTLIDTATNTAGTPIPVGSGPDAIAITPNGATAYVMNEGDNTVTPIVTATNSAGTSIPVGTEPTAIAVAPDGNTVFVANTGANSVTPINTATNTAGAQIPVGSFPEAIAVS